MTSVPYIKLEDHRTNKSYMVAVFDEEAKDHALKMLRERVDYDYFESLPAEQRANTNKKFNLDFNCPNCLKDTEISSRKETLTTGFLFFFSTRLIDVFKCSACNKEFFDTDLRDKKAHLATQNIVIENFENWKQAKKEGKTPPEFYKIDRIDQVIISSF